LATLSHLLLFLFYAVLGLFDGTMNENKNISFFKILFFWEAPTYVALYFYLPELYSHVRLFLIKEI